MWRTDHVCGARALVGSGRPGLRGDSLGLCAPVGGHVGALARGMPGECRNSTAEGWSSRKKGTSVRYLLGFVQDRTVRKA